MVMQRMLFMQMILADSFFFFFLQLMKKHSSFIFLCKIRAMSTYDSISKQEE